MPAPICVKCQMTMRCQKNEQLVNDVTDGQFHATYWVGDLFECPVCEAAFVVVYPVGASSVIQHRVRGRDPDESITFAYGPEQREQYADQFEKQDAQRTKDP